MVEYHGDPKFADLVLPSLYERFEEEAQREYMSDKEPDEQRFKKTISDIEQLKEFAITQKAKWDWDQAGI